MRDAAQLHELCKDFRFNKRRTTDEDVALIEAEVAGYRKEFLTDPVPQLPPDALLERLPLMGWLIYEASWYSVRQVRAAFEALDPADRAASELAYHQVKRLANAARALVWPEFAGRALGAVRAQALAESKRDTQDGYDAAYIAHQEANERYRSYRDTHGDSPDRERYLLDLDEVLLQLALAETGTACRTAERVISRWSEQFAGENEQRWAQRMYRDLADGVAIGMRALETAERIKNEHGLVHEVTAQRLAMVTGYRNPGIMTARAILLMLTFGPAMEDRERLPTRGESWRAERADLLAQFAEAYHAIEEPVYDETGALVPMVLEHRRALVQLRLNLALLVPGHALPAKAPFDPCLALDPLDDGAVDAMSSWLSTEDSEGGPNHGNTIGSATLPLFDQCVIALRTVSGSDGTGFVAWREKWFELGRHANQAGRRELVEASMREALSRPSLRVSAQ